MRWDSIRTGDVQTQVKNPDLVEQRRRQIIRAAVPLFVKQGFHKTTTRQIAREAGVSVGSMYEYLATKEDILYLVCLSIHDQVERGMEKALAETTVGRVALSEVIREFFLVCHRMSDQIVLMYQVTKSLPPQLQKKVLENDIRITNLIVTAIKRIVSKEGGAHLTDQMFDLIAHNITVMGHMWTFRRWHFSKAYTIEEYIQHQTRFILKIFDDNLA